MVINKILREIKRIGNFKNKYCLFLKYFILNKTKKGGDGVVLIKLDAVGDCVMFSSCAKVIKQHYKNEKITVVCRPQCVEIFKRMKVFDEFIPVEIREEKIDLKKLVKIIDNIRLNNYGIILQPRTSRAYLDDILAMAFIGDKRIAIENKCDNSTPKWVNFTNQFYDEIIKLPKTNIRSEFDYYGTFIRGAIDKNYKTMKPEIEYNSQSFCNERYYVIYPCGSSPCKWWPTEKYTRLIDYIYKRTGLKCLLLGTSEEGYIAEYIQQHVNICTRESIDNLMGKTTVGDIIDIIGNAEFVISNDTSGAHIACATNTPSIAIVGGGHYERFFPYHIESVKQTDQMPIVAFCKTDCFYCDWNFNKNLKCFSDVKDGNVIECVRNIELEDVKKLVNRIIINN